MGAAARVDVTDETLMLRYQRGDMGAFATLVARHEAPLFHFALRHVRSSPTAEDIVQEVFVRVIESSGSFKHEARFSTWVYTIARNLCIDHLRKMSLRRHPSLDEPVAGPDGEGLARIELTADPSPGASTERVSIGNEIAARVSAAVAALPDDQREVFLLRQVAGLAFREIATVTEAPENTVKSRMRYALERLQEALVDFDDYARALR